MQNHAVESDVYVFDINKIQQKAKEIYNTTKSCSGVHCTLLHDFVIFL